MTISILKLETGQTIPRPFARAGSWEELVEILQGYARYQRDPIPTPFRKNLDTDYAVWSVRRSTGEVWFFAFTEQ